MRLISPTAIRSPPSSNSLEQEFGDGRIDLDQLWDLLRRRRAARRARKNPDDVEPRDRRLVEKYLQ